MGSATSQLHVTDICDGYIEAVECHDATKPALEAYAKVISCSECVEGLLVDDG